MISNTISFIFTWTLFVLFTSAAVTVKDTLYYDLLVVNPYCVVTYIRRKCENFPLPNLNKFVYQKEEALRLHQIKQEVCQILLDGDSRREYDLEGPKLNFNVNEFSQLYNNERILQILSYNDTSECYFGLDGTPFVKICVAHVDNEIGNFFESLRSLQKSKSASYIYHLPNPPPLTVKFSTNSSPFLAAYPPYNPQWDSFDEFLKFLDKIILFCGPYLDAPHPDYTIFDRLKVMRRQLNNPREFMAAFSKELSPESFYMLFRTDPLGSLRTYLPPDHPVFNPIPSRVNTNVGGEVQPMNEEEERIRMHDAKRKLAYAQMQEDYNNNQEQLEQKSGKRQKK